MVAGARVQRDTARQSGFMMVGIITLICLPAAAGFNNVNGSNYDKLLDSGVACGVECLYTAAKLSGMTADLPDIARRANLGLAGSSLLDLKTAAESMGFKASGYKCEPGEWKDLKRFSIAHVKKGGKFDHFVLVLAVTEGGVYLVDPPDKHGLIPAGEFCKRWTGNVLELTPPETESPKASGVTLALSGLEDIRAAVDVGTVQGGREYRVEITLCNELRCPVEISKVTYTCSCLAINSHEKRVAPGSRLVIPVRLLTSSLSGRFQKKMLIQLRANDKDIAAVVTMAGTVRSEGRLQAFPESLLIETWPGDRPQGRRLRVRREQREQLSFIKVSADQPWLSCAVTEQDNSLQGDDRVHLVASLTEELGLGDHQARIRVETAHARCPAIEIPVVVKVLQPIEVSPPVLFYQEDAGSGARIPKTYAITLKARDRKAFSVSRVSFEPAALGAVSTLQGDNTPIVTATVDLTPPKESRGTVFRGQIRISLDHPACRQITIPIVGRN